jgi:hypothetical protein
MLRFLSNKSFRGVFALFFITVVPIVISAQTSTPAPTKTPEPTATDNTLGIIESTEDANNITQRPAVELAEPFTQVDLNVLVGNVQRPNAITWLDDYLYVVCNGDWTIYEIESTTGATQTFIFGVRDTHAIYAEETESGFDLWLPDFAQNTLFRVDQSRSAPDVITQDNLDAPWGITALNDDFLITNIRGDNIIRIDRNGELITSVDGLRSPAGIIADNNNHIYVVNNGSARRSIEWFNAEELENDDVTLQPLVSGLQNTSSIDLADDGYLYFTYALGSRGVVGRINPEECRDGGCTNDQVEIVVYTDLPAPLAGLTISPDMRLFVHTIYRPEIYWIDLDA